MYCVPVLDYIEKKKPYFAYRLFNSHVIFENADFSVKFYDFLFSKERKIDSCVIVESKMPTYSLCVNCGIPISPFVHNSKIDEDLIHLAHYLNELAVCPSTCTKIVMDSCKAFKH